MKFKNLLKHLVVTMSLLFYYASDAQIKTSKVTVEPTNNVTTISGDLGVGTSNPQAKVDVDGHVRIFNQTTGHGILELNTLNNDRYSYINLGPGTGYGFQIGKDINNGGVGGSNNFYIYDFLNSKPRFVIDDMTGNVGLGTTNPLGRLHVVNQAGGYTPSNYLVVEGTTTDNNNYPGIQLKGGTLVSNDAYPHVASTNGGLSLLLSGGSHNAYNQRMLMYLSSNSAGSSNVSWYRNSTLLMHLDGNTGNLGIGTTVTATHKLQVNGLIKANGPLDWPDFVFEDDYELPTLEQVENDIARDSHLPGIPSAKEVREEGIDLTEMDAKLLQKIEELTLYLIEQNKEIKALKEKMKLIENQ